MLEKPIIVHHNLLCRGVALRYESLIGFGE